LRHKGWHLGVTRAGAGSWAQGGRRGKENTEYKESPPSLQQVGAFKQTFSKEENYSKINSSI
jgi:hypothetical protein